MKVWGLAAMLGALLMGCATADPGATDASTTPASTAATGSGIHGRSIMTPGCAVERLSGPCPPIGVAAHLEVRKTGSPDVVARLDTAVDGRFTVDLPPGRYSVTATLNHGAPTPQAQDLSATVSPDRYASLVFEFDSGIRGPSLQ